MSDFKSMYRATSLLVLLCVTTIVRAADAMPESNGASGSPNIVALKQWLGTARLDRPLLSAQKFATASITKAEAQTARQLLWDDHAAFIRETRVAEWKNEAIAIGSNILRLKQRTFGTKPPGGWNLFISMHGGGGAPAEVNDQQWENQIQLYQPKDSLYIAPRAPTNNWNLWHESHIDELFDRLIEDAIVLGDVDPDHVYLMGYSAGGDGVYQLAPRMADRWAAASMMAGHPNDASPLGLRNVPFAIHVGALDSGFNRNNVARQWGQLLDDLHKQDPDGYTHIVQLHEGRGHWMNLEDKTAVDWMERFTRNPIPAKVVWRQASTTHERLYWLAAPKEQVENGQVVVAAYRQQEITIEKAEGLHAFSVRLSDAMLDLDQPVTVTMNGKSIFKGKPSRTILTIEKTLQERGDPDLVFDAEVNLKWEPAEAKTK